MELPSSIPENKCDMCPKTFVEMKRLYRHLFDSHGMSKQEIEGIKSSRRKTKVLSLSATKDKPLFTCDVCRKPYLSKLGLMNHKVKYHDLERPEVPRSAIEQVLCPINACAKRFQTYFDLAAHCDGQHRDLVLNEEVFRIHRMKFPNYDKFQDWKSEQEQLSETRLYTRSTETKCRYGRKTWFMKCLHTQKTSKTVDFYHHHCPAFVRVVERHSGACEAVACFGHLGHPHFTQNKEVIQYMKRDPREPDYLPVQKYLSVPKEATPALDDTSPIPAFNIHQQEYKYNSQLSDTDEYIDIGDDFLQEDTSFST